MKTILIVEAVAAQRELLASWLKYDYTVLTAADGESGMALAAQAEPDLLFMGLSLPDGEGLEVMRQLHARPRLREIPIIALTAQGVPPEQASLRAAGCVGTLALPLEEEQVQGVVRSWLGGG
ncbi:MAG: response regulator [Candidatus Tectimicrobiota bacterium]